MPPRQRCQRRTVDYPKRIVQQIGNKFWHQHGGRHPRPGAYRNEPRRRDRRHAITFTGSVIAFLKLDGRMSGKPIMIGGRHFINAALGIALIARS
jgi:hypothetical protein